MGGQTAAELAAYAPCYLSKLVHVSAAGLWIPEHPIPDLFAFLPHEYAQVLFHDPAAGAALLTGGLHFTNLQALADFYIPNSPPMAAPGQILFPHPHPRVAKPPHRVPAESPVPFGKQVLLIPPGHRQRWH